MTTVSLLVNIAVLLPVVVGILRNADWARAAYGPRTPARGILTALYLTILAGSAALLVGHLAGRDVTSPVVSLLVAQVVYKVLSPVLVGDLRNPVVLSNLAIAALHVVTVWTVAGAGT